MNQYALSALKEKRSTLAGEILDYEKRAARRRGQLTHIDAVIKIMDTAFDLDSLPVKQVSTKPKMFGRGEIPALCMRYSGLRRRRLPCRKLLMPLCPCLEKMRP